MSYDHVHVIINPASGYNEPILNTLNDVFKPHGGRWGVSITHAAGDGEKLARAAVERGCDLVMAYGGDGTILDVANGLIRTGVPLGILPGGTANAMASEMGIPANLRDAAQLAFAADAAVRDIDVGKTGDRHFLLRVGTGMVAWLNEGVTREMKDRFGIAAYIIAGVQALTNPHFAQYTITIDGDTHEIGGSACLINNGTALGAMGLQLSKNIRIDDGLLDVYILRNDLQTVLGITGGMASIDALEVSLQHWQGREIHVQADPPQQIFGDGEQEAFDTTPSTTTVLPGALKVLVPGDINTLMAKRKKGQDHE